MKSTPPTYDEVMQTNRGTLRVTVELEQLGRTPTTRIISHEVAWPYGMTPEIHTQAVADVIGLWAGTFKPMLFICNDGTVYQFLKTSNGKNGPS